MKLRACLLTLTACASAAFTGAATIAVAAPPTLDKLEQPVLRSQVRPPSRTNVVLVTVRDVVVSAEIAGLCVVDAHVDEVLDGAGVAAGQVISIPVPCSPLAELKRSFDGSTAYDPEVLRASTHALARLDAKGQLVWREGRAKLYPRWGSITGFRLADEVRFTAPGGFET